MRVCLACKHRFAGSEWRCPLCNAEPERVSGFPAFAPSLAEEGGGFRPEYFQELADLEAGNFWFRARNRLIIWSLGRYFSNARSFFEIGCGTGFVLAGIAKAFPRLELAGSELFAAGLGFAAQRVPQASLCQMDARLLPFDGEFDVVAAFDVLEHIEEDSLVLGQMFQATRPGGGMLLTVPQHPFLWSHTDESACHVRRYTARELVEKVEQAGFTVVHRTSFVSLLLPLMAGARLRKGASGGGDVMAELRMSRAVNAALEKVLDLERIMIRLGIDFPIGGSLLLVARKG